MEERPPIPKVEDLMEEQRQKYIVKQERRTKRRKEASVEDFINDNRARSRKGPSLKERHTDVVGGPEVVGGEERVVLESTER